MSYSRKEVFESTLEYFNGDVLATDVWINKYSLKDADDGSETNYYELTPDDMHRRIAKELARIENKYPNPLDENKIFDLIKNFQHIVPQGSPMAGIGNNKQVVSLSNCFVIGNESDSYGGIFMTDQEQAQLMKRRGGVGHDLSHIRPKGTPVKNSALTSTGIVPFMERFSNTTREVAQDGRRGALMLSCFSEKTFVLTDQGWIKITDVIEKYKNGEMIKAWTHKGYKDIIDTQEFNDRDIYEIEVENGEKIEVTADHEFMVKNIESGEEYLKAIIDVDPDKEELILYI
jgi:hypothetical protein